MNLSNRTILRVLAVTAGFLGLIMLAYLARKQLAWIGIAFFLAVALNPAVTYLEKFTPKKSRGLAIFAVLLLFVGLLAALAISFVPPIASQTDQLVKKLPAYSDELTNGHSWISDQIRAYNLVDKVKQSQDQIVGGASAVGGQFFDIARGVFSSLIAAIAIVGLTYFMLLESQTWLNEFWRLVPKRRRAHAQALAHEMYLAVTGYVNGNLLTSMVAFVCTSVILAILGVPYAIPLGIVVGILDLLPLIGATLGAIVVVTVSLFSSLSAGVIMLVFFIVYQQIENHVLQPIIYGKTIKMSPLLVLVAAMLGASVGGIVGALVAIPLFAGAQILFRDYASRHLAD